MSELLKRGDHVTVGKTVHLMVDSWDRGGGHWVEAACGHLLAFDATKPTNEPVRCGSCLRSASASFISLAIIPEKVIAKPIEMPRVPRVSVKARECIPFIGIKSDMRARFWLEDPNGQLLYSKTPFPKARPL